MKDKLFIFIQYILPKKNLSKLLGYLASLRAGWLTHQAIRLFVKKYGVDLKEAEKERVEEYTTFNDFFTRALKKNSRYFADSDLISPVDGTISQLGKIHEQSLIQAKGKLYSVYSLLADDEQAADYNNGQFATLYLSPKDYHRIHMPLAGRLKKMVHVPGDLFSVNPTTANNIDNLFARNERVICYFDHPEMGEFVVILVGATVVGSIKTSWHGVVNPIRPKYVRYWHYEHQPVYLDKGQELGQFLLGSTVIVLFKENTMQFTEGWEPDKSIRMGEEMGRLFTDTKTRENFT